MPIPLIILDWHDTCIARIVLYMYMSIVILLYYFFIYSYCYTWYEDKECTVIHIYKGEGRRKDSIILICITLHVLYTMR